VLHPHDSLHAARRLYAIDAASLPSSDEVRAVFEHASLGMALSRNRVIVRCNRVFAQLFGKSVADWVGQPGLSIFRDEEAYVRFGELAGPVLARAASIGANTSSKVLTARC
jgi:PAS domain-containing protein